MSLPTEADFALVKVGDGADPEVFTALCGIFGAQINRTANTNDRFRRDCATPGVVPLRKVRTTGKQLDITSSGAINIPDIATFNTALGVSKNYKIELYKQDGTDTGDLLSTITAPMVLTSANTSVDIDGEGTAEVTLASDGAWTEVAA